MLIYSWKQASAQALLIVQHQKYGSKDQKKAHKQLPTAKVATRMLDGVLITSEKQQPHTDTPYYELRQANLLTKNKKVLHPYVINEKSTIFSSKPKQVKCWIQ